MTDKTFRFWLMFIPVLIFLFLAWYSHSHAGQIATTTLDNIIPVRTSDDVYKLIKDNGVTLDQIRGLLQKYCAR